MVAPGETFTYRITITAIASGVITPKGRTAGSAVGYGNDRSFSTALGKFTVPTTLWAPTCLSHQNRRVILYCKAIRSSLKCQFGQR